MSFKVVYNPGVQNDIQSAVSWYNEQLPGLGKRFLNAVKKDLNSLTDSATHYAIKYDDIHCMKVNKFPYMIHYQIDTEKRIVKVEAVFHTSRNPKQWYKRNK